MIVVAVIAIIAAIAIPNFIRSRMTANEASAIASLKTITTVNELYAVRFNTYAPALADLNTTGYVDDNLGSGSKSGYLIVYAGGVDSYTVSADPQTPGTSGARYFFTDESGVIRFNLAGPAGPGDSPVD